MRGVHWSGGVAVGLLLACVSGSACEFPECGSETNPDNYPGGYCMQSGTQSAAGSGAPAPTSASRQALIGFREHPQYGDIVPAWLMPNNLATFDVDALVDGTRPDDQWHWSSDGTTAYYDQNGVVAAFQNVVQLYAPQNDQRLDGVYELVDYDGTTQLLRFANDGTLTVCDTTRRQQLHETYKIDGFALAWTRETGAVERHALLYEPEDLSQMWIGSRQLTATRSPLCSP
jgi:hypothetical protein